MIDLIESACMVQALFEEKGWRFCFIGGLAVQHWGEPRVTRDLDLSLFTGFGGEKAFVETLLQHFDARIDDCLAFALRNRVVLLQTRGKIGIDIAMAGLPFEEEMIQRSHKIEILQSRWLTVCTAEDLVVLKAFAARLVDWHDVETILARQGSTRLDWDYIDRQLTPLVEAKEEPEILDMLAKLRAS